MKKIFGILITSMFVVTNSLQLFSQSIQQLDDQYGFRGVKFETPLNSFNGLTEVREDCYKLKNENLKFGKYELNEVVYRFYKGLLSNIILKVDANNNLGVQLELIKAYGTNTETLRWIGKKVTLEYMETSPYEHYQVIIFTCNKLKDLEKADEKQAEYDRKRAEILAKREADSKQMEVEEKAKADEKQAREKKEADEKQAYVEANKKQRELQAKQEADREQKEAEALQPLDEKYGFQNAKFEMPFSSFKGLIEVPFEKGFFQNNQHKGNLKLGEYDLNDVWYSTAKVATYEGKNLTPSLFKEATKVPFESYYQLKNENSKIGDYELEEVVYRFYKGLLSNIIIKVNRRNSEGILNILCNAYGKGKDQAGSSAKYWMGKKVTLAYRDQVIDSRYVIIVFTCNKLSDLEEADQKQNVAKAKADQKQMEIKAVKDL